MGNNGGFHLVAKIIRELKSHMIPYKFKCSHWWKIAPQVLLVSAACPDETPDISPDLSPVLHIVFEIHGKLGAQLKPQVLIPDSQSHVGNLQGKLIIFDFNFVLVLYGLPATLCSEGL